MGYFGVGPTVQTGEIADNAVTPAKMGGVLWLDDVEMESLACYRPHGTVEYGGYTWVAQLTHDGALVGTSPFSTRRLAQPSHAFRRLKQVSKDGAGGVRILLTSQVGANLWIEGADDIFSGYADDLTIAGVSAGTLERQIVDMGDGRILFFTYGDNDLDPKCYYSKDGGANWGNNHADYNDGDPIFTLSDYDSGGPIRHFHGGVWDEDNSILYVFTGDQTTTNEAPSVLVCDDVFGASGLLQSPNTWLERWALRDADHNARQVQLAANPTYSLVDPDADASVNRVGQGLRILDIEFDGDYGAFADDRGSGEGGESTASHVYRVHRTTHVVESIGRIVGTGRGLIKTAGGHMLQAASSCYMEGAYRQGHDKYSRVYEIDPARAIVRELRKWERSDSASPAASSTYGFHMCQAYGRIWGRLGGLQGVGLFAAEKQNGIVGRLVSIEDSRHQVDDTRMLAVDKHRPTINMLEEGKPVEAPTVWSVANATIAFDNGVLCPFVAALGSWIITPTGDSGRAYQTLAEDICQEACAGNWVCFSGWVKLPTPQAESQAPQVMIRSSAADMKEYFDLPADWFDGEWHQFSVTCPGDAKATADITAWIYAHSGVHNVAHGAIYVAGLQVVIGTRPNWFASAV